MQIDLVLILSVIFKLDIFLVVHTVASCAIANLMCLN